MNPYTYRATVVRVVDGDTIDLDVDLGFHLRSRQRFRLLDYNAPETRGPERLLGIQAKADLVRRLPSGAALWVETHKGDSFGRWLCDLWLEPAAPRLQDDLVREGWGVRWDGRGRRPGFNVAEPYPLEPAR